MGRQNSVGVIGSLPLCIRDLDILRLRVAERSKRFQGRSPTMAEKTQVLSGPVPDTILLRRRIRLEDGEAALSCCVVFAPPGAVGRDRKILASWIYYGLGIDTGTGEILRQVHDEKADRAYIVRRRSSPGIRDYVDASGLGEKYSHADRPTFDAGRWLPPLRRADGPTDPHEDFWEIDAIGPIPASDDDVYVWLEKQIGKFL